MLRLPQRNSAQVIHLTMKSTRTSKGPEARLSKPTSSGGERIWRQPPSYAYGSVMEPTKPADREEPAPMDTPVYGDDPGLGEGYSQEDGYGHNQESMLLHHPDGEGE